MSNLQALFYFLHLCFNKCFVIKYICSNWLIAGWINFCNKLLLSHFYCSVTCLNLPDLLLDPLPTLITTLRPWLCLLPSLPLTTFLYTPPLTIHHSLCSPKLIHPILMFLCHNPSSHSPSRSLWVRIETESPPSSG